jgi:hypothetical protein
MLTNAAVRDPVNDSDEAAGRRMAPDRSFAHPTPGKGGIPTKTEVM